MKKAFVNIITLLFALYLNAQQAFTNNGNLQIYPGASIASFGNFTNTASGALINNGTFYIKGNIINDQASMNAAAGVLHLNGTSSQSFSGSQPFKTFDFFSNNFAGVILNNNVHISGTHTFTNGIITTSATPNYLVYEAGSSYTGDNDLRHVNGWVKKIGATDFIFPIGNGTIERTVTLKNMSGASEFNAGYRASTPSTNSYQAPLKGIDPNEYWIINKISGGTATVTMNWDNSKVAFPLWVFSDIRASYFNGVAWTDAGGSPAGSIATIGNITSNSTASFNLFTFGNVSDPLSLTLMSFTAKRMTDYTQLNWITDNEIDVAHFTIERSDNGTFFYAIRQIPARNAGRQEYYSDRDSTSINNIAYYRLRCTDKDGHEKLSKVVVIRESLTSQIIILTNPVHDNIILVVNGNLKGTFNYHIDAVGGQLMQRGTLAIQNPGQYQIPLSKTLNTGFYLLDISNGSQNFRYKIIVR